MWFFFNSIINEREIGINNSLLEATLVLLCRNKQKNIADELPTCYSHPIVQLHYLFMSMFMSI